MTREPRSLPFQGSEDVPFEDCIGKWVVVHDCIMKGNDDNKVQVESINRSRLPA